MTARIRRASEQETFLVRRGPNGMKLLVCMVTLFIATAPGVDARGRWQRFHATAYSAEGETASGKQTREGRTIAADPAVLPLGSRVQVRGTGAWDGEYVVHDTGRKIDGKEIDIFIDNPVEAKKFGRKAVRVRVLSTPEKSAAAVKPSR